MFHLIPAPLHRGVLRIAHRLRTAWWRVRAPVLEGCRVLALDPQGNLLLVRHSYVPDRWMPPGGGLDRAEHPLDAARRELFEETRCTLDKAQVVDRVTETLHGAENIVNVVVGTTTQIPRADRREIVETRFFALDQLPEDLASGLAEHIPGWIARYRQWQLQQ